eukprot:CAMPEP_0177774140 /NCGR_PEP_ID=MMETSP0491_2-20121128/13317_1 /TAXON_ID=63592 /ORGANISM="Tetraselmis chuii, Strain PLY429" /LENGTH=108 /DNA_ID=CAMNT_0019292437 /DNA_START=832 /DNA_END=1159 /DNA_ORIENTATION=+
MDVSSATSCNSSRRAVTRSLDPADRRLSRRAPAPDSAFAAPGRGGPLRYPVEPEKLARKPITTARRADEVADAGYWLLPRIASAKRGCRENDGGVDRGRNEVGTTVVE